MSAQMVPICRMVASQYARRELSRVRSCSWGAGGWPVSSSSRVSARAGTGIGGFELFHHESLEGPAHEFASLSIAGCCRCWRGSAHAADSAHATRCRGGGKWARQAPSRFSEGDYLFGLSFVY